MLERLGSTLRMAFRNLSRNRWRSALTAGGIAVAVGAVIWTGHMFDAMFSEMVRGVTAAELGDVQLYSKAYLDERNLYNGFDVDRARLDDVRAVPGVDAAAGRVIEFGLIGHEDHSSVAKLIGVDAVAEQQVTRTPSRVSTGRWLSDSPNEKACSTRDRGGASFRPGVGSRGGPGVGGDSPGSRRRARERSAQSGWNRRHRQFKP
jgi:ABC-type lipoprotein release transport system permease subunit